MEGPKILGKVELPVEKAPTPKNPIEKGKRKRIRKGGLSQEEIKKVATEQSKIADERKKEKYGTPRTNQFNKNKGTGPAPKQRIELTEEEIQAQIKETLARLSSKGDNIVTGKQIGRAHV